jgi:hypothetical protein
MKMEKLGSLIVFGEYAGDLEAIAKVLNAFEYEQDVDKHERFVVVDGRIQTDSYLVDEDASVMPYRWDVEGEDEPRYDPSLEDVSGAIAPLLTSGTLELVSIKCRFGLFIDLERLSIRSDGWAQIQSHWDSGEHDEDRYVCSTATYEPGDQCTTDTDEPPFPISSFEE